MESILNQLKKEIIDELSYLDCVEKRLASAKKMEFSEERCNEVERLFNKTMELSAKLTHMKSALVSLRKAAGHKDIDIDVFHPERF